MDLDLIKKLVKIVDSSDVTEISIEEGDLKIKVSKRQKNSQQIYTGSVAPAPAPIVSQAMPETTQAAEKAPEDKSHKHYEIRSPIVGTFYRAPAPDADPYIQVGDIVTQGTVLCIVEAMKLMNEIESDVDGKIIKILAENGKPVEYNQPLFLIEQI